MTIRPHGLICWDMRQWATVYPRQPAALRCRMDSQRQTDGARQTIDICCFCCLLLSRIVHRVLELCASLRPCMHVDLKADVLQVGQRPAVRRRTACITTAMAAAEPKKILMLGEPAMPNKT